MTEHIFIDACYFKNFAAGDGLWLFDRLFPKGASTGINIHYELSVKHADDLLGRITAISVSSGELLNGIAKIQLQHRSLSTADAELLYLAKYYHGTVYTDDLPIYEACRKENIACKRFLGCLQEAVTAQTIHPAEAIAFLNRVKAIKPPRRFPPELLEEILAEWQEKL